MKVFRKVQVGHTLRTASYLSSSATTKLQTSTKSPETYAHDLGQQTLDNSHNEALDGSRSRESNSTTRLTLYRLQYFLPFQSLQLLSQWNWRLEPRTRFSPALKPIPIKSGMGFVAKTNTNSTRAMEQHGQRCLNGYRSRKCKLLDSASRQPISNGLLCSSRYRKLLSMIIR